MSAYASTHNVQGRPSFSHVIIRVVSLVLLLTNVSWLAFPTSIWASVYKCVDQSGRTVLTNRKTEFQNCQVILESATGESKSGASKKPKPVSEPMAEGAIPPFVDTSPPPNAFPNEPWMYSSPGSTSSAQPCAPGVNPLNPMSTPPCTPTDDAPSSGSPQPR